ncbi:hypothetical protein B0H19DRAFT_1204647 [Mycena capillaripes]|nr:hypothetical protein B0H19DRAFT_1204647 [Mycena capillaripes]
MAYQDPYAGQYGRYQPPPQQQYGQQPQYGQQYGQEQYGHQQQYGQDDPAQDHQYGPHRQATQHSYADAPVPPPIAPKSLDESSSFDPGEFTPNARGPKTASNLRQYRLEFQGPLWTRGGRGRCFGRFFCCTLMSIVFLFVTILLTLVLFLRPPSIDFGDVAPMNSGSPIQLTSDGININMGVNISVNNPNFFAVNFKKINAEIFYPIDNNLTAIGNGTANNVVLSSTAQTNFTAILLDLAEKCGILGTKTDLRVHYKITLGVQILFVTISPSISNDFVFPCPLDAKDLQGLLGGAGLGGSTGRR